MGSKGLLEGESTLTRRFTFFVHLIMAASLIFLQLGFMPLGFTVPHYGSILIVIGPVIATGLLLGVRDGAVLGLCAALLLVAHAFFQPCDIAEHLCMTPLGASGMTVVGALSAPLFVAALRHDPIGRRRRLVLLVPCVVASVVATGFFIAGALISPNAAYLERAGGLWPYIHNLTGSIVVQLLCNFAVAVVYSICADAIARTVKRERSELSVRLMFRLQLLGMVSLALLIGATSAFIRLTQYGLLHADSEMSHQVDALLDGTLSEVANRGGLNRARHALEAMVDAYDLGNDGMVVIHGPNGFAVSNSHNTRTDGEVYLSDTVFTLAGTRDMGMTFYEEEGTGRLQLGFVRTAQGGDVGITLVRPASGVFRDRFFAMLSIATTTVILLTLVYVYAARLLNILVANPIDRTNEALDRMSKGDLDHLVEVRESSEFSSLSDGINRGVTAIRAYSEEQARRIEEDLATAQSIQQSALPRQLPLPSEEKPFDIYAAMLPAKDVGGDFYDFFLVDDHILGFLIADVSGKGIPAALFMMEAKNEISSRMQSTPDLAEAMDAANATLCAGNDEAMFVTVWAATLDWDTGELCYVNAGHNQPLLRHEGSWQWMPDDGGPMMGIGDFFSYESHTIQLEAGDELLLYTDGVTEALNRLGVLYGDERIREFLQAHADLRPKELDTAVRTEIARWAAGAEQSDDITTLILEYEG